MQGKHPELPPHDHVRDELGNTGQEQYWRWKWSMIGQRLGNEKGKDQSCEYPRFPVESLQLDLWKPFLLSWSRLKHSV